MAVGVDMDGIKHILGLWIADNEGAALWASVCADLANRGVQDVFIVCCDGCKGLPEAVEATWPNSMVQTCIVHLIRAGGCCIWRNAWERFVSFLQFPPAARRGLYITNLIESLNA